MKKKFIKLFLKSVVSLGFVAWIVFKVEWGEVWTNVQKLSWMSLFVYAAVILIGILISAAKWKMIAAYKKINLTLGESYRLYLTGSLINNFMPSFIGGDTYRAYQIGRASGRYSEAASTVVMDRISGFLGSALLSLIFAGLNWNIIIQNKTLILIYVLLIFSFIFDIAVARSKKNPALRELVKKMVPEKIIQFLREIEGFDRSSRIIQKSIAWGALFAMVGVALANYILFWALGVAIDPLNYLSVIFLISILAAVPVSINNIGVKEWAYITFFGYFGVDPAAAVTVAIINRFLQMLISFAAVPAFLRDRKQQI